METITPVQSAHVVRSGRRRMRGRTRAVVVTVATTAVIVTLLVAGVATGPGTYSVDFTARNLPPASDHPFGTDWMGRDMLHRTVEGLSLSIVVGGVAAALSSVLAVLLGVLASVNHRADRVILWCIDLFQGIPHLIVMIFVSILIGRGVTGVMLAVALTHWPPLTRVIRAQMLTLRNRPYVSAARALGIGRVRVAVTHLLPHVVPQVVVGSVLMFPHAILHEASLTFLGFGVPPEQPAIGVILSESMRYLSTGTWWLAVIPGTCLVLLVLLFDALGHAVERTLRPATAQI